MTAETASTETVFICPAPEYGGRGSGGTRCRCCEDDADVDEDDIDGDVIDGDDIDGDVIDGDDIDEDDIDEDDIDGAC